MLGSTNSGVNLVDVVKKQSFNFYIYFIDADFIPTMRMKLSAGENFAAERRRSENVMVNEEAIRLWGIPEPASAVGKKIDLWGSQRTIIGVIKNFHQASAKTPYLPMTGRRGLFPHNFRQNFQGLFSKSGQFTERRVKTSCAVI